jgi:hypothetical protein
MYTNENISFKESYQAIVEYYQQNVTNNHHFTDPVLSAYIAAMHQSGELTLASKQLLEAHQLVNDNGELYTLEEIVHNGYDAPHSVFDTVLHVYNEFSNNTHTKINIDTKYQKDIADFFAAIAGIGLNTLANRSFATEKKVARLILSKINIA